MNEAQLTAYMTTWHPGDRRTEFAGVHMRAWYNPMRYISGEFYYTVL